MLMVYFIGILKVLEFAATEGAIGVHCHAGLGRTGIWLI